MKTFDQPAGSAAPNERSKSSDLSERPTETCSPPHGLPAVTVMVRYAVCPTDTVPKSSVFVETLTQ